MRIQPRTVTLAVAALVTVTALVSAAYAWREARRADEARQIARVALVAAREQQSQERERVAHTDRNQVMVEELAALTVPESWDAITSDKHLQELNRAYDEAFRAFGVDIDSGTVATTADQLRGPIQAELAASLDYWALARRETGDETETESWRRLHAIAARLSPEEDWSQHFRQVVAQADLAIEELRGLRDTVDLATLDSRHALALGRILWAANERFGAIEFWKSCLHHRADDVPLNATVAVALASLDPADWREATSFIRVAVALRPRDATLRAMLGRALYQLKDVDGSVAELRFTAELDADQADAHYNLGVALRKQGNATASEAAYRTAISLEPTNSPAHYELGNVLSDQGQHEQAADAYRNAVEIEPHDRRHHRGLAIALFRLGDYEGSIAATRREIELDPENVAAWRNLGLALRRNREYAEAREAYLRILKLDPKNEEAKRAVVQLERLAKRKP